MYLGHLCCAQHSACHLVILSNSLSKDRPVNLDDLTWPMGKGTLESKCPCFGFKEQEICNSGLNQKVSPEVGSCEFLFRSFTTWCQDCCPSSRHQEYIQGKEEVGGGSATPVPFTRKEKVFHAEDGSEL